MITWIKTRFNSLNNCEFDKIYIPITANTIRFRSETIVIAPFSVLYTTLIEDSSDLPYTNDTPLTVHQELKGTYSLLTVMWNLTHVLDETWNNFCAIFTFFVSPLLVPSTRAIITTLHMVILKFIFHLVLNRLTETIYVKAANYTPII